MHTLLPEFFHDSDQQFLVSNFTAASPDDIFSILEALDGVSTSSEFNTLPTLNESSNLCPVIDAGDLQQPETTTGTNLVSQNSIFSFNANPLEGEVEVEIEEVNLHKNKKQKVAAGDEAVPNLYGQQHKVSHITVERNRRKQMNENLTILRSLLPCFYVKKGDQASIVGGVVDYITELHQVLQSLEAKKQRKVYSEILSPRVVSSSPRNIAISPRKPPPSPRLISSLPISPTTPQPTSPYKHHSLLTAYLSPTIMSPTSSSTNSIDNELASTSKSGVAEVEVKFSGSNVLLKTVSAKIPGQALKIISALEDLSLEILNVSISTIDETMIHSFTIKIGIDCQLSADDLALHIQQTFC